MQIVELKPLLHNNTENIGIYFRKQVEVEMAIRKIKGVKWSQSNRCWYLPLIKENYQQLSVNLKGLAGINASPLKNFLEKRKRVSETFAADFKPRAISRTVAWKISSENILALTRFIEQLKLKAYSSSTIITYRNEFLQLLQLIKNKNVNDLSVDDLRRYFIYCSEKLKLTENSLHSRLNAIKFYYEQVVKREKFFWEIPRPKKPQLLPKVLGEEELEKLFKALTNRKHKAMLFTAYSAGLRVSEVAALKIKHVDSGRMQIFVEKAKGKKDRYVNLSPVLLDILRAYIKRYRPKPLVHLFESEQTGTAYPTRTIQRIFQLAKQKAGIRKEVGIHSLRHSFATHLLEKGTDIKYIKDILGHFDIRTTERYLHVSKKSLVNVVSPLDDLWKKGKIDW